LRLGEGHAGQAALERRTIHIPDLAQQPGDLSRAPLLSSESFVAYFGVPLLAKGHVEGVLEIFQRTPLEPDREWLDFLEALAGQAAIALDNATLFGSLGVVDQAMAATLGPGNVAILNYSNKLVLPILGIGSTSLATVLYPMFSRLAAEREWRQLQQSARRYVTLVLAVTIPATVVLVMLSPWLVEIIFQRGAFSEADAQAVARVQALYLLMIPAYTAAELLSRIINALGATSYMAITSAGIFLFNFIADYVLKEWIGLEGIALATVLNFSFSVIVNIYLVRRLLRQRIAMSEGGTG
jgi:peptidoglycan biosynthesis protein MviN/MurJ (putative lipid II flippase)